MEDIFRSALKPTPSNEELTKGFGQIITRRDIQTLIELNRLNDEVINFYLNLIIERGQTERYPSVYAFNTFFYPKFISQGYSAIRKWTKKVDIFQHELLLVPIHLGNHWCMATVDFRDKTVRYYDSLGGGNNECLIALRKYIDEEHKDKKNLPYDTTGWKTMEMKGIPQQKNGIDCGVFSCMYAEYISRNVELDFSQEDMACFRLQMTYEILAKKLVM